MSKGRKLMLSKAYRASAGAASRFVSFLRRHRIQGILDLTSPPDVDSLFVILEVEKRAGIDGRTNLPSSSEEGITGSQKEIVDYHRKLQEKARRKVKKLAARLLAAAKRVEPSEVMNRVRDIPSKCQNNIDRVLAEFDSKLQLLHGQEEYERQRLDDDGEQSKEDDTGRLALKAISFLVMLGAVGVAALALGSSLMWGVDDGSLLSADPAIAIAAIAVVVPFLVAVGASNPASGQLDRERPAFRIAILLTTVFLVLLAFFCAHLITLSSNTPASTATDVVAALTAMTTDPGAINADVNALKGLGVVMVMGLVGFMLGKQIISTDAENSSGRAAYLRACREREELSGQLRNQINGIVDLAEKDVDRSLQRLQKQFKKLSRLAEQAGDTQALYDDFLAGLEESCNLLLERYREANAAERDTDIPPSFSEQICFRMEGASRKSFFENGIERHRKSDEEMKDLSTTVAEVRRALRDMNRDTIRSLDAVEFHEEVDQTNAFSTARPVTG